MELRLFAAFETFLSDLETFTVAKVLRTLDLLERFGPALEAPHTKKVAPHLFELRIRGRQEVRCFYTFSHGQIILVHAFLKKGQKIPRKELLLAQKRLKALDF